MVLVLVDIMDIIKKVVAQILVVVILKMAVLLDVLKPPRKMVGIPMSRKLMAIIIMVVAQTVHIRMEKMVVALGVMVIME